MYYYYFFNLYFYLFFYIQSMCLRGSFFLSQTCENEIKCVVLKCPLQGLDGTTIELRSRLWNSTFIEVTCCILMCLINVV